MKNFEYFYNTVFEIDKRTPAEVESIARELTQAINESEHEPIDPDEYDHMHLFTWEMPDDEWVFATPQLLLNTARAALISFGGSFEPTNREIRAAKLNERLASFEELSFCIGGFFGMTEVRHLRADHLFVALKFVNYRAASRRSDDVPPLETRYIPIDHGELIDTLTSFNFGAWDEYYSHHSMMDGESWEVRIDFSDGNEPFISRGSNAYPDNFAELCTFLDCTSGASNDEEEDLEDDWDDEEEDE